MHSSYSPLNSSQNPWNPIEVSIGDVTTEAGKRCCCLLKQRDRGNSNIFGIFTPNFGEDEPILTSIFFQMGWLKPPSRKHGKSWVTLSGRTFWSSMGIWKYVKFQYGCWTKNRGVSPKMDGENHWKPYFLMDDLGVSLFSETSMYRIKQTF